MQIDYSAPWSALLAAWQGKLPRWGVQSSALSGSGVQSFQERSSGEFLRAAFCAQLAENEALFGVDLVHSGLSADSDHTVQRFML